MGDTKPLLTLASSCLQVADQCWNSRWYQLIHHLGSTGLVILKWFLVWFLLWFVYHWFYRVSFVFITQWTTEFLQFFWGLSTWTDWRKKSSVGTQHPRLDPWKLQNSPRLGFGVCWPTCLGDSLVPTSLVVERWCDYPESAWEWVKKKHPWAVFNVFQKGWAYLGWFCYGVTVI